MTVSLMVNVSISRNRNELVNMERSSLGNQQPRRETVDATLETVLSMPGNSEAEAGGMNSSASPL